MKIAIVHDYLMQMGGAERVVLALHALYPHAPLYTSVYDPALVRAYFPRAEIRASFLQRVVGPRTYKFALTFYPAAFESFDLRGFDVVLSSSSSFAKGVITPPETCHVSYCHTPARFAWRHHEYIGEKNLSLPSRFVIRSALKKLRMWDLMASYRVDFFLANSANVARRIQTYYRRDSAVIEPPVEITRFRLNAEPGDFYLVVSRLLRYKRVDLAVEACNRLRRPLIVIGSGPEAKRLRQLAGPTVRLLGQCSDEEVAAHMAACRALIFPGEEDFGITPLEAMASGRPVIAYGAGGARETVLPGVTGLHFAQPDPDSLADALCRFEKQTFDRRALREWAEQFRVPRFQQRIERFVEEAQERHAAHTDSAGRTFPLDQAVAHREEFPALSEVFPDHPARW